MARPPWLTRNLTVLSAVSLLQDCASELMYPLVPLFLTVQLGAPAAVVGLVDGVAEGVAAVTKVVSGRWGDRFRRRPLIAAGYGAAAVGKAVVAAAPAWPLVLAGRSIDRWGKGVRGAPRDALLMDGALPAARGRIFGFHRAVDTVGAVIGPLLALVGYLAMRGGDLRPLLLIATIPAALSVGLVAVVREDTHRHRGAPAAVAPSRMPTGIRAPLGLLTLAALVNFPDSLLLLRVHALGFGVTELVIVYALYNVVYAGLSLPAGLLSDRFAPPTVFAAGLAFFAVGYCGLGLAASPAWVSIIFPLYGGFAACTDGVGKTWISRVAGPGHQATAQGLYQGLSGIGVLVAGVWAGVLWGDGRGPLVVSGVLALLMAGTLIGLRRRLSPPLTGGAD